MASIEFNRKLWNDEYGWQAQGDEWSSGWGGVDMQWYGVLLPRLHHFLPTGTLLEIAPGQGRWTQYLASMAKKLIAVDLSPKCVEACKTRFDALSHLSFYVNDGATLDMIEDRSVDFAFSFDSLVHCEADVIESYIRELSIKLSDNGIGFVHHSNMAEYSSYFRMIKKIPRGAGLLSKMGLIETKEHLRAHSMSAERFEALCRRYHLRCIGQEIINWDSRRLIDCISMFCRKDSHFSRPNRIIRNHNLTRERGEIATLSKIYGDQSFNK